jgi:site-specific DNA recombinase
MSRLIDLYQDGVLDRAAFEPRLRQAQERLRVLEDQMAAVTAEQSRRQDLHLVVGQVETFARLLEGSLEQADWATKRQVITALVKQIEIGEQTVRIVYKVDSPPFAQAPEGGVLPHCWWRVGDATQNNQFLIAC